MKISVKKTAKVAGAVCAATGIVALSALVASGAAVGAVVEGFKSAKNTMKKMLADEQGKETLVEDQQSGESAVEDVTAENESASEEIVTEQIIFSAAVFGAGMSMVLISDSTLMVPGIIVGVVGIVLLLCLIPLCKGLK